VVSPPFIRIVIAAGTKVRGRVTQIGGGSKFIRARADLNGNFRGGIAYYPASVDAIGTAALEIARQIRNQYTIAYAPLNQTLDGSYRRIRLAVANADRLSVRTRAGYRATPPGQSKP